MEWLEGLGLFGLFIGTFLAATIFPFSSDALYLAILAATANPVGCLLVGYEINPLVTLGAAVIGLSAGAVRLLFPKLTKRLWLTVLLSELIAHLLGSVVIKTVGLAVYYSMPFIILMLWRLLNYLIIGIIEGALIYVLMKNPAIGKEITSIKK